ncbi:hypothetical protein EHEL_061160 [Encephalitozoon hellem ATCC 50504]|uniref:Ribosomal protein L14-like protein n=1 Tax=Encephalitozoon hellem TaxID=27973 RepID=A0A9Q9CCM9_ENCHE|nr:uncharacterized protein EHEL_061160 [Encephalitozoon hellem ATCC 50504]AFM98487.1 hypothetical protein EHEL_061160 [Encephalitozoon hellem ATCC 50504]UTX43413.1 ribosomal protein L14-like protein [Encephalitozoon hellem]WEL38877.1 ribosomal protein L14-like protein [Encephalitozoon hellem]|eukprot:XP_003887468.1 hypothetical protein EHEL_061160 [Encephalitozoon hellem ATCC 50504]
MRTVKLGRIVAPALKEKRHTYGIIVGIIDATFVLIQRKDGEREMCSISNLHLDEKSFDIKGLSAEEIGKLIPESTHTEDTTNDFDRFKMNLRKKVEESLLKEKGLI